MHTHAFACNAVCVIVVVRKIYGTHIDTIGMYYVYIHVYMGTDSATAASKTNNKDSILRIITTKEFVYIRINYIINKLTRKKTNSVREVQWECLRMEEM